MRQKRRILKKYGMWLLDIICIIIATYLAVNLYFVGEKKALLINTTIYYQLCLIFIAISTIYSFFFDWNRTLLHRGYLIEFRAVLIHIFILLLFAIVVSYFLHFGYYISRMVYFHFAWIDLGLTYLVHILYKNLLFRYFRQDHQVLKIVVVAEKDELEKTIQNIFDAHDSGIQIVGAAYADCEETGTDYIYGIPIYCGSENLPQTFIQVPFDEVLINAPDIDSGKIQDIINGFEDMGVDCHYCLRLPEHHNSLTRIETFKGYDVVTYTMNRNSAKKLILKRLIDIIGGIVGLIITGILCIFLIPAIKLDSKGPVFFSQTRVGKNGRRFKIYKFRSMYIDAEDRLQDLEKNNEMNGLMFKMKDDPRVTRVGKFIRKTSLDEFPQFWNVLRGDMSLVGTRPPTEQEFEHYNEHYRRRLQMTPGLTGLWQVSGRSDIEDFDEVVKLDLEYIDNWSLSLDFKIILKTIGIVFTHKGAK